MLSYDCLIYWQMYDFHDAFAIPSNWQGLVRQMQPDGWAIWCLHLCTVDRSRPNIISEECGDWTVLKRSILKGVPWTWNREEWLAQQAACGILDFEVETQQPDWKHENSQLGWRPSTTDRDASDTRNMSLRAKVRCRDLPQSIPWQCPELQDIVVYWWWHLVNRGAI